MSKLGSQLSTKSCQSVDEAGEIMQLSTKSPIFVDKFKKNDLNQPKSGNDNQSQHWVRDNHQLKGFTLTGKSL